MVNRGIFAVIGAVLCLLYPPRELWAINYVYLCGDTCTTNCVLAQDIICNADTPWGVRLLNGSDLDMNGKSILCTYGVCGLGSVGILPTSNSDVKDSVGGSRVRRFREAGIDCTNSGNNIVDGIKFESNILYGILECNKVKNNVVIGSAQGIKLSSITASDYINHNLFVDIQYRAINISGSGSAEVDHNSIMVGDGGSGVGIDAGLATSAGLEITNNSFFVNGSAYELISTGSNNPIMEGNVCDDRNTACQTCISDGECTDYVSPFVGP